MIQIIDIVDVNKSTAVNYRYQT